MRQVGIAFGAICLGVLFGAETISTPAPSDITGAINAAVAAATPAPCGVPQSDSLAGSAGVAATCMPRNDATRPTVVQAASVTTDANGAWVVTWTKTFSSSAYYVNPQPGYTTTPTQPVACNFDAATQTPTSVRGQCWRTQTMTIPAVVIGAAALVINPTGMAASVPVRVIARDTTQ